MLGQLGNRVQHALRAFTPRDQKAVKAAAETMRANPDFKAEQAITELEVGEALISFLDEKGRPNIVQRAFVIAPDSRMGVLTTEERNQLLNHSDIYGKYEKILDRKSAYEKLTNQTTKSTEDSGFVGSLKDFLFGSTGPRGGKKEGLVQTATKSVVRQISNQIIRGILGDRKR
ncbi:helicase HerA-like domain-containing protein [Arsenophonus endosymbiont of Aleurodicus floccissimus]|uniref:helicase HerA-like domain-containing protein n=1 Tax=Arsenophonus endosymbiont of Aleurodicus floccissimus TaxID=2152761 RepID=UPI003F70ACE4